MSFVKSFQESMLEKNWLGLDAGEQGVVVIMDNWEEARKAQEEAPWRAEEDGGDPSVLETP